MLSFAYGGTLSHVVSPNRVTSTFSKRLPEVDKSMEPASDHVLTKSDSWRCDMLLCKLASKVECQKYRDHEVNQPAGYRLCFIVGCKERFAKVNRCLEIGKTNCNIGRQDWRSHSELAQPFDRNEECRCDAVSRPTSHNGLHMTLCYGTPI